MQYASVCDGIGAAHAAWNPLGWSCVWTSEIERFPIAVVEQRWGFTNLGDMLKITESDIEKHGRIDLLVGGTPCQSFSVAGLRGGLDDPRGNLALRFCQLAGIARPRWVVWENVPGVLSSGAGEDFGSIIRGLEELGYGVAWRSLDAQYFGLAQRRERVFAVGYLGDWRPSCAVLLEPESLRGDSAPGREAGSGVAGCVTSGIGGGRGGVDDNDARAGHIVTGAITRSLGRNAMGAPEVDAGMYIPIAHALTSKGFDASEDGTGRGTPLVPIAIQERAVCENPDAGPQGKGWQEGIAYTLEARNKVQMVATAAVRRLTPRECEKLQGFPVDYTLVQYRGKPAADGPRYAALGNSMAVPVMAWIGERIDCVDRVMRTQAPGCEI